MEDHNRTSNRCFFFVFALLSAFSEFCNFVQYWLIAIEGPQLSVNNSVVIHWACTEFCIRHGRQNLQNCSLKKKMVSVCVTVASSFVVRIFSRHCVCCVQVLGCVCNVCIYQMKAGIVFVNKLGPDELYKLNYSFHVDCVYNYCKITCICMVCIVVD